MPRKIKILPKSILQFNSLKFCANPSAKILNYKILVFKIILISPTAAAKPMGSTARHFRLIYQKAQKCRP